MRSGRKQSFPSIHAMPCCERVINWWLTCRRRYRRWKKKNEMTTRIKFARRRKKEYTTRCTGERGGREREQFGTPPLVSPLFDLFRSFLATCTSLSFTFSCSLFHSNTFYRHSHSHSHSLHSLTFFTLLIQTTHTHSPTHQLTLQQWEQSTQKKTRTSPDALTVNYYQPFSSASINSYPRPVSSLLFTSRTTNLSVSFIFVYHLIHFLYLTSLEAWDSHSQTRVWKDVKRLSVQRPHWGTVQGGKYSSRTHLLSISSYSTRLVDWRQGLSWLPTAVWSIMFYACNNKTNLVFSEKTKEQRQKKIRRTSFLSQLVLVWVLSDTHLQSAGLDKKCEWRQSVWPIDTLHSRGTIHNKATKKWNQHQQRRHSYAYTLSFYFVSLSHTLDKQMMDRGREGK